jgi:hypothetical protein
MLHTQSPTDHENDEIESSRRVPVVLSVLVINTTFN